MELATSAAPDIIRKRKPRFFRAGLVKFGSKSATWKSSGSSTNTDCSALTTF